MKYHRHPSAEKAIDPALPIIDAHHHLLESAEAQYRLDDYLGDAAAGHNIVGSVYIECGTMYRADGPPSLQPVGETEFADRAAQAGAGRVRVAAGIVGRADLALGDPVGEVLDAHQHASRRFRGIRQSTYFDPTGAFYAIGRSRPPQGLMGSAAFRA